MNSKSVCILVQNDYEVDVRVRRKAEALLACGFTVDVLALRSALGTRESHALNGLIIYTIGLGKKRGSLVRYAYEYVAFLVWAFFKVSSLMRTRRYAIVDVNNLPDFLVFAAFYAKCKGARIVFDMHEITPEFYISKYGIREGSWMIRLLEWVEKASFDFADHVLLINQPIQDLLAGRGLAPSKTTIIMNSVDESLFAGVSDSCPAKVTRPATAKFVMMYHGTLTRIYGLDIAIEAFGRAQALMPGAEFWVLGSGTERDSLEALAQKLGLDGRVKFVGVVRPDEVVHWLDLCDVGVLATRQDVFLDLSFSNKLPEYIIMGKAVITSRLQAIRHYFSEDALAFFEPNNPEDLARQMIRLYRDKELRLRQADRGREEYAPICWEIMKQRSLDLMNQISGGRLVAPNAAMADRPAESVPLPH